MVYFYKLPAFPAYTVYMGLDKYENDKLIRFGWPEDVWFHVDDLSSAHVYVRTPLPATSEATTELGGLPAELIAELAQLTKANSIEGCKKDSVDVVYTKWENLLKSDMMAAGTVSFKDLKAVSKLRHVATDKEIVKRIEKTRTAVDDYDYEGERHKRDRVMIEKRKRERKEQRDAAAEAEQRSKAAADLRSYATLQPLAAQSELNTLKGDGSIESCKAIEEDFM
eukprot:Selendium_serpulae@DN414_c0_g1_i1.p1